MSERHIDAEGERRLTQADFLPVESRVGKRRWKDPDTGRVMPGGSALDRVERREEKRSRGRAGSGSRQGTRPTGASPTPGTCTLAGPPTTSTSAVIRSEGQIDTPA